ncbi:hypothetical protein H4R23_000329, partial [Coemansia sp. Cherry 401B]
MSKANEGADTKRKARDAALEFLNELGEDSEGGAETSAGKAEDAGTHGDDGKDAKGMLKFIDDLTESAKRSTSPVADSSTGGNNASVAAEQPAAAAGGGWSWGGIWGQATALVEQNQQLKSGLGKLKDSISQVRNAETSKSLESRVRTLVNQENITKLGGDFKRSLDTVIDTIAPPIPEHEVFNIHLVSSLADSNIENVIYRTMDAVFDFHGCGAINLKSAATILADAPEMQTKRGDTFTLPKGFDGGYGAAVTAVQFVQNALKTQ